MHTPHIIVIKIYSLQEVFGDVSVNPTRHRRRKNKLPSSNFVELDPLRRYRRTSLLPSVVAIGTMDYLA
jgi:hypothetical protein